MNQIAAATVVLGVIGFAFSLLLAVLNRKLQVKEDPDVERILKLLPGLNCGACGFSSCRAYAQASVEKPEIFHGCRAAEDKSNTQIAKILGNEKKIGQKEEQVVVCLCGAGEKDKKTSSGYQGLKNCQSAHLLGGALDCTYGCLAFGDCQKACPTGAIVIKNKKVQIEREKCILCGKCQDVCPRNLFAIIPKKDIGNYFVACQNKDTLKEVKDVCGRGCIACGVCTKIENSPYCLAENLSRINYEKAKEKEPLEKGKNKCPTKCIDSF